MRYLTFAPETGAYPVILLTKRLIRNDLIDYVRGIESDVVAYSLPPTKTPNKAEMLEYLKGLLPIAAQLRTDYLLVTDGPYFKTLTGSKRVDRIAGYVLPCVIKDYEHVHVIYMPSPEAVIRDPVVQIKVNQGRQALADHRAGNYMPPGNGVIQFEAYPSTLPEIKEWLAKLLDVPLAIDIETRGLKHYSAGIGTITMCWSQHEGIAFCVDKNNPPSKAAAIRELLKAFFEARSAKTLYHRTWFDIYVMTYQLFMTDVLDTIGMLHGIKTLLRGMEDTQIIRYLATNTCAGNKLSLKDSAQEFVGNYAIEVKDIDAIPVPLLLTYNLYDGLATWYVYNTHYPVLVKDDQLPIYEELLKPILADIIQMQLTGLPMDMAEVIKGKAIMEADRNAAVHAIMSTSEVATVNTLIADAWAIKRNSELKVKRVTAADCKDTFNLNSPLQLQVLLHDVMQLPVLERTDSGQPATGMDVIEDLDAHATTTAQKQLLGHLINYKQVEKILSSFIPAFEAAHLAPDGWHYLYGGFNPGGTLSGRLSSSDPNLQNLPSTGTKYAKLIKKMFKAPKGKLLIGMDFNSLEDMISALTTKDPNKLKVYTDGFDGHCLRAAYYFSDQVNGINIDDAKSVNTIKKLYPALRQDSKAPTFALTYQGTWRTLVKNCGFSPEKAQEIEARYHELYQVSDAWVQDKLNQAAKTGYVTLAFGLRLRTPMMKQTIMNLKATPYEAVAEGRTAGNALGQSYCMLNSRAGMEFMQRVRKHPEYSLKIQPCAQIHDAQYYLVDDDIHVVHWMNANLAQCVQWQQLPEIQHPTVKLGGEMLIFYPSWADELSIPNGADLSTIQQRAKEHISP